MSFRFQVLATDKTTRARNGRLTLTHGEVDTPVFMPVGTFGAVRTMDYDELDVAGVQIILGNTYHLYLRPGLDVIQAAGGYHEFIAWKKPILTDSGGFQVFSLPHQRVISEKGVTFKSYVDQSYKFYSPEIALAFQEALGSDIMMPLDVCIPSVNAKEEAADAMHRTHRWAQRLKLARTKETCALFGIVQGAIYEDLRTESAETLVAMDFDGYSIGGLAVGESEEERYRFTEFAARLLPDSKPRYLMGVGTPSDIVRSISYGVDMFDCIIPTNHARQGIAYTWGGKVKMRRTALAKDFGPIDADCACATCRRFSRAYLHQLIKCDEFTGWKLIAQHNVWFYERLMEAVRDAIGRGDYEAWSREFLKRHDESDS